MKILLDMNLSPAWIDFLDGHGLEAVHWRDIGDPEAEDRLLLSWARDHQYVVFTHDLDFGAILAATGANAPSVIQVRAQNVTPGHLGDLLIQAISEYELLINEGALIVLDEKRVRVRILPLFPNDN
ncbi:MAG: hypothetical protein DWQ07_17555 [Chloroflexi bacterium]|nr:MAG: hypothetical protein DWQ07_17555 [Chloroflexota bacterium]